MSRRRNLDTASFVGRDTSLDLVVALLSRRRGGDRSRVVVVAGEAGVGKTRLTEEVVEALRDRGVEGHTVRVSPALGSLPLGALAPVVPVGDRPAERRSDMLVALADALVDRGDRLLVVDDAHLVDATSAAVLHLTVARGSAAGRSPRMLLTVRTGAPTEPSVAAIWKDGLGERIDLDPLDRAATGQLATGLLGTPLDGVSANDLWEASRGNPLFIRELIVGAVDQGLIERRGSVHSFTTRPRASSRLAELLGARLDEIPVDDLELLDVLAVAGELGLDHLRRLARDDASPARLERLGFVRVDTDGRRRPVRLVHPLYGEVIRSRMGKVRELAVHRRLADELETLGARRDNDVLDLARWRLLGGGDTRPEIVLRGARHALARFDAALARDLAVLARRHGMGVEADLVEAEALEQQGRHADAAAVLSGAVVAADSDDAVVRAATALSVIQFWTEGDEERATATVEAAARRVADPAAARRLEAHAASFAAMANRPADALERSEPHLVDGADPVAFTVATLAAGPALTVVGRAHDAADLVERALPVRLGLGDGAALPDAFKYEMSRVFALSEAGSLDRAAAIVGASYELAASMRALPGVAWSAMLSGRVALLVGDVAGAAASFAEAAELFDHLDEQGLRSWSLAGVVLAAAARGDPAGASAARAVLDGVEPGSVVAMQADVDRARAWERRVAGDVRAAERILTASIRDHDERGAFGMSVALLHDLVRIGASDVAAVAHRDHRAVQGTLARCRLDLVDAVGSGDAVRLERTASAFAALGSPLFAAETWALAAVEHRRVAATRAAATAVSAARELVEPFTGLSTPPLATLSVVRLTAREREVAELAAAGCSSREIAVRLDRSVRTVENHLQRVYDKLGVDGRPGLARALASGSPHV